MVPCGIPDQLLAMGPMSTLTSQGYQVVRNVFTSEEILEFRAAITETIDRVARVLRAPFDASCPAAPLEERIDRIAAKDRVYSVALFRAALADCQRDPRIEAIARHSRLTAVTEELLAPMTRTGQTIRARAAIPALSSARSPWHQDVVRETDSGCGTVRFACWIPLDHVGETSGALEVIPGAWTRPLRHEKDPDGGRFSIGEDELPSGDRQVVPLRRGDVLVLDRFTPHRSLTIEGSRGRWAVVMWVKGALHIT
jgi:ectoine hydroxylase-related dioxygenase (phytanoyl-CoA dioxygenase family)